MLALIINSFKLTQKQNKFFYVDLLTKHINSFMAHKLKKEDKFSYIEVGEGTPIIILHGLMGGLSNFDAVTNFFSEKGYKVLIPELPIYSMPLLKTNVKNFANYLKDFIEFKGFESVIIPYQNVSKKGESLGNYR
mgnify:CR=1 FL=1